MRNALKSFLKNTKGALDVSGIVVDVVLVVALIPVIKTFIASATNLTATETALLVLVTLFIVIGLVVNIGRQTGLIKGKNH